MTVPDRTPAYQRITEYLCQLLPSLEVGDELPTIAELCERFGVAGVQTVRNGVQPLVDAEYVETRYQPRRRWVVRRVPPTPPSLPEVSALDELRDALTQARRHLDRADAAAARLQS